MAPAHLRMLKDRPTEMLPTCALRLCTDLAEEISANFEALPFAMASDSDNDAGTSIASDPGTHGPPCRIAAVATAQQRKPLHCLTPPPAASAVGTSPQCRETVSIERLGRGGR